MLTKLGNIWQNVSPNKQTNIIPTVYINAAH